MRILHLAREADWRAAQELGVYRVSTRGATLAQVGFIHASTPQQLPAVAESVYAGSTDPLVVLVMDDDAIRSSGVQVKHEDGGDGELYPHIYGAIRTEQVSAVLPAHFDSTGHFAI
jgi:uncharacterized protein (DUF952 family)